MHRNNLSSGNLGKASVSLVPKVSRRRRSPPCRAIVCCSCEVALPPWAQSQDSDDWLIHLAFSHSHSPLGPSHLCKVPMEFQTLHLSGGIHILLGPLYLYFYTQAPLSWNTYFFLKRWCCNWSKAQMLCLINKCCSLINKDLSPCVNINYLHKNQSPKGLCKSRTLFAVICHWSAEQSA